MRIRTVKPEFFTDSKVREIEPWTRLLFIGLWCFADDEGRFEPDIPLIKAAIFPGEDVNVAEKLAKLEQKKMIKRYRVARKDYFLIPSWKRHQVINRPSKPRIPPPIRRPRHSKCAHHTESQTLTEHSLSTHGGMEGKGREVEHGKEGKTPKENPSVCRNATGRRTKAAELKPIMGTQALGRNERQISSQPKTKIHTTPPPPCDDGGDSKVLFEMLEPYLPHARIRKLMRKYPPERLRWAAERTAAASEARPIKKPASYLLRILRNDEQWERYICDQYALGRVEALQRQKRIARERLKRGKTSERRKCNTEDHAFVCYLNNVPEPLKDAVTDYALKKWAEENDIDLDKYRKKGWLLKRSIQMLYETHVRQIWQDLGKPRQFIAGKHILLPTRGGAAASKKPRVVSTGEADTVSFAVLEGISGGSAETVTLPAAPPAPRTKGGAQTTG